VRHPTVFGCPVEKKTGDQPNRENKPGILVGSLEPPDVQATRALKARVRQLNRGEFALTLILLVRELFFVRMALIEKMQRAFK